MNHMYLTKMMNIPSLWDNHQQTAIEHEEIECILEIYLEFIESLLTI